MRILRSASEIIEFSYRIELQQVKDAVLRSRGGFGYNSRSVQLIEQPDGEFVAIVRMDSDKLINADQLELANALDIIIQHEQTELDKQKAVVDRLMRVHSQIFNISPYR